MIRVAIPPEPANFSMDVLIPGRTFLQSCLNPTRRDWSNHRYWSKVHGYLYSKLNGICSYCASYTPPPPPQNSDCTSVDHYVPKSLPPHVQAYEWENLRLSRSRLNNRKGSHRDVLDPYVIANNWFWLDFVTFEISANAQSCPPSRTQDVLDTIKRLGLNSDVDYVNERTRVAYMYADGAMSKGDVDDFYPFIYQQMVLQNFDQNYLPDFKGALSNLSLRRAFVANGILIN